MMRPLQKQSLIGSIVQQDDDSGEESAYRGRIMLYAACEKPRPEADEKLQVIRLPLMYSKTELEGLMPRCETYALRCDLYDATELPAGPFDSVYVVVALGPHERRSTPCVATEGVVRFESEAAIAGYVLSSLPWLLMTVHTLDGEHKITSGAAPAAEEGSGASEEDRTLRMSFAANSERNLAAR